MTNQAVAKPLSQPLPRELLTRFGETFDEAAGAAREAVERYVTTLLTLEEEALSKPVSPGRWSPLGFTDHLRKVTNIHVSDIRFVMAGGKATRRELGAIDAEGRLVVTIPGAEPGPVADVSQLVAELRAAAAGRC